jgi:uncharacterized protein (TIGR02118 family)
MVGPAPAGVGGPRRGGETFVFQLIALYNQPEDVEAFDEHYDEVHAPLAAKFPGVQRMTINRPGPDQDGNKPAYHLIAVLDWADEAAFQAAAGTPEMEAGLADLPNFAGAGVTILTGPARAVV